MASIVFTLKKTPGQPSKVHSEVMGATGPDCVTRLAPFLAALGQPDAKVEHKTEYAEATVDANVNAG